MSLISNLEIVASNIADISHGSWDETQQTQLEVILGY